MRLRSLLAVGVLVGAAALVVAPSPTGAAAPRTALHPILGACGLDLSLGHSHCNLSVLADSHARPFAAAAPTGYGPADLRSAYALPTSASTQTVAIVDAYDDKTAEADLGVYRSFYGLSSCTTANGCFKKVNQNGVQGSYPANNPGWALEISLDIEMVSAVCPTCHILLVEATNNQNANLYKAVDTAVALGASVVSNSYGGSETSTDPSSNVHFNHPGVAITVSSGDSGYGVEYPAASPYVTAVGGTSLTRASNARGWSETVWSGAGSGCSKYETAQSWEPKAACSNRTVADVSAVADPNTGVSVYDSNCPFFNQLIGQCFKGWGTVGGTSVAAPVIGAVYALAANASSLTYAQSTYTHASSLNDVTSGSNGSCSGSYLCTGGSGYDGPTGNGTPNGVGAF
ncbi:MAG TPA: S53 family peptidase [Jatrophihabitantaceae bacterium]|nr:S53 family peptidase [Jatrophihabitantaceae bacterium]